MEVINAVICDDIRQEIGNKFSLMGIYVDRFIIETKTPESLKWPLNIKLGIFVSFKSEKETDFPKEFEFQVFDNGAPTNIKIGGSIVSQPGELRGQLIINIERLSINKGSFGYKVTFLKDGKELCSLDKTKSIAVEVKVI